MKDDDAAPTPGEGAPRRTFLTALGAMILGGLASVPPMLAGVITLFDPLRPGRHGTTATVMVTRLGVLPENGVPQKVTVTADRVDAWTTYKNTPVGAVYLRRTEEDGVEALNVVCPHAGCFVGVAPDRTHFACPCHRSRFELDGTRTDGPSPRNMDSLDVEVRNGDEIWVQYQNFLPGTGEKIPVD